MTDQPPRARFRQAVGVTCLSLGPVRLQMSGDAPDAVSAGLLLRARHQFNDAR